jgi:hypothetical protein
MNIKITLPIFPLNILPLPNELIPLHIFEPRYRQLLEDVEKKDIEFGIYFVDDANKDRIGSVVKLESILKRYDTGESDIVVRCTDIFLMVKYNPFFKDKLYAGGDVFALNTKDSKAINPSLLIQFKNYLTATGSNMKVQDCEIHDIANVLDLDNNDRLKYARLLSHEKRESFLRQRLNYKNLILEQEVKSKNIFHLN